MSSAASNVPTTWTDTLIPRLDEMRAALRELDVTTIGMLSGAVLRNPQTLLLPFFDEQWLIAFPEVTIRGAQGQECSPDRQAMLLYYLTRADGTNPAGRWIAFRELPDGRFYAQAFQGYSGNRLARFFVNDVEAFERAATRLGGRREALGDACYSFWPLPRVGVAAQYWRGDDEFPPRAVILLDAAASHYLPTDGLAVLGSQLVSRLTRVKATDKM